VDGTYDRLMRMRRAFLVVVVVAAVFAVPALARESSSRTDSAVRAVRDTVTEAVMAMRADNGPRVCSLMTGPGETFFLGLPWPKHGPCGPLATAILKRVKWTAPLALVRHDIAVATFVSNSQPPPFSRSWSNGMAGEACSAIPSCRSDPLRRYLR
jgi:hypothetical protein